MWLINTLTFQLEHFINVPVQPPAKTGNYAILSHTWDQDEVVFQDMADLGRARLKKGWAKIEQTCRLAQERALPYAWVDTCCIDKSSSAELTEAINSMYRWYELSNVCFVWLADLVPPYSPDFMDSFGQCRWFTRGWTLQELVAPGNIEFLNHTWTFVGTKSTLETGLALITGIDAEVLRSPGKRIQIPVGKRMSWAASRRTTREEDVAYCLLGIFGVNMPLLYGEGKKAFIRLQEQIVMTASTDLSLFAWRADSAAEDYSHGMLAASPDLFRVCKNMRHPRFYTSVEILLVGNGLEIRDPAYKEGAGEDNDSIELDLNLLECSEETKYQSCWVTVCLTRGTRREFYRAFPKRLEHCTIRQWLYNTNKPAFKTLSLLKAGSFWDAGRVGRAKFMYSTNILEFDPSVKPVLWLPSDSRLPYSTDLKLFRCQFAIPISISGVPETSRSARFRPIAVRIGQSPEPRHIVLLHGLARPEAAQGDFHPKHWRPWIRLIEVCPKATASYYLAMTSILASGANLWSLEVREAQYAVTRDYVMQHWTDTRGPLIYVDKEETASPPLDIADTTERNVTHRFSASSSLQVSDDHKITLSYQRIENMDY